MSRKLVSRQLSLQCETPPSSRPRFLRKQFSEDLPDSEADIRIALIKSRPRDLDRPPPVRVAWCENNKPKQLTKPLVNNSSDIILYSRSNSKQNLNIVLTQINYTDEETNEEQDDERTPRLIPQLQQEIKPTNCKSIFQKHLRNRNINQANEKPNEPIVVVPIIERVKTPLKDEFVLPKNEFVSARNESISARNEFNSTKNEFISTKNQFSSTKSEFITTKRDFVDAKDEFVATKDDFVAAKDETPKENYPPPNSVPQSPTPSTQSRRQLFQKRANSAFHSSIVNKTPNFRPPLIRASSVPNRADAKPKYLANRRKLKVKRKEKPVQNDDDDNKNKNTDVVTMVSLISSSESEEEEESKPVTTQSPKKTNLIKRDERENISLRKAVKSVTFQQSSMHAIRSFSASFPARRSSIATTLLLGNAAKKLSAQKSQEKRAPIDDEEIGPKRRLVRSATTELRPKDVDVKNENIAKETEKTFPISIKEKECWETYRRMNERGVNVSFDTILRGMLTPTEYRERRKLNQQQSENE